MTTIEHDTQQPVEPVEAKTTTALAIVTRAIEEINAVDSTIAALEEQYRGVVFEVTTTEGMKSAKKAREEIRESRYALQNMQKAAKKPLNELKTSIDETIEERVARLNAIESPVDLQIKGEELRKEAERKAKAEAEAKRVAAIEERITDMRNTVTLAAGGSASVIADYIRELEAVAVDATFAEFQPRAETAKAATLVRLQAMYKTQADFEANQHRLEEERAAQTVERERLAEQQRAQELRSAQLAMIRNNFENRVFECSNIGTLAAYDGVIEGLETYIIDKADYGDVTDQALIARATALDLLRTARAALNLRLVEEAAAQTERDRLAEESRRLTAQKAEQEAEAQRLRDEAEAQRLANEQAARASAQPVSADQPEVIQRGADAELQEGSTADHVPWGRTPTGLVIHGVIDTAPEATAAQSPQVRWRPKDEAIVHVVATTWNVSESVATAWLVDLANRFRNASEAA